MRIKCSGRFSLYAKGFAAGQWSFLGPGWEKKWYSTQWIQSTKRMGQNCRANDVDICRKQTPSLPMPRVHVSRAVLKSKGGGKLSIHYLCRPGETIENCFSHNYFCKSAQSLRNSRRKCVKNTKPFMIEQWQPVVGGTILTHCSCQVWWRHTYLWPMILHNKEKIYCKDIRNELKSYHNKIEWVNFVLMQDSWSQLKSDSIVMTKDTE